MQYPHLTMSVFVVSLSGLIRVGIQNRSIRSMAFRIMIYSKIPEQGESLPLICLVTIFRKCSFVWHHHQSFLKFYLKAVEKQLVGRMSTTLHVCLHIKTTQRDLGATYLFTTLWRIYTHIFCTSIGASSKKRPISNKSPPCNRHYLRSKKTFRGMYTLSLHELFISVFCLRNARNIFCQCHEGGS